MKDLGEEYNKVIIQELIPSSAFGNSLLVKSGDNRPHFQMQNILTGKVSGSWFLGHPLGLSAFTSSPRLLPSLFFLSHFWGKSLASHMLRDHHSLTLEVDGVRRRWSIKFKDPVFSGFHHAQSWVSMTASQPLRKHNLSLLGPDTLHPFILTTKWMFLAYESIARKRGTSSESDNSLWFYHWFSSLNLSFSLDSSTNNEYNNSINFLKYVS